MALEFTRAALAIAETPQILRRQERLRRRVIGNWQLDA
jgi:hypothetical protein